MKFKEAIAKLRHLPEGEYCGVDVLCFRCDLAWNLKKTVTADDILITEEDSVTSGVEQIVKLAMEDDARVALGYLKGLPGMKARKCKYVIDSAYRRRFFSTDDELIDFVEEIKAKEASKQ